MAHLFIHSGGDEEMDSLVAQLRKHVDKRKAELEDSFKTILERLEEKKSELMDSLESIFVDTEAQLRDMQKTSLENRRASKMGSECIRLSPQDIKQEEFVASLEVNDTSKNEVDIPFITINKEPLELNFFLGNYFQIKAVPNPYIYKKRPTWESSRESNLNSLQGVAVSDFSGEIYVADSGNKCVHVFSNSGECKRKIKDLKMSSPRYICVSEKYLYASCWDNKTILKLDNKKCVRMHFTVHPDIISGLAVDKHEDVYGCVWKGNSIVVWDKDLVVKSEIKLDNLFITENSQIRDLSYFNKEFYVLFEDSVFPVQIFNRKGELVRCPVKASEISSAKYMTLDQYGNVILSDSKEKERSIKIFSNKGELVHSIKVDASSKHSHGDEDSLKGIGFDCLKGNIYICDSERVHAY